jgi:hypothetical protein
MEIAMGDYEADAGSGDALRAHLEAIRTESARIGTQALRAAASTLGNGWRSGRSRCPSASQRSTRRLRPG